MSRREVIASVILGLLLAIGLGAAQHPVAQQSRTELALLAWAQRLYDEAEPGQEPHESITAIRNCAAMVREVER